MHDVMIVGGRCAGAPLAMLLARAGHNVLVVDRATFPSDTLSTHFIQSPGMAYLARWGLMDDVIATNCRPITDAAFDADGSIMELEVPLHPAIPGLVAPRRYILDKLLIDAAVVAGAELAEGVMVDSLIVEDDRVVGVRGNGPDGGFEARARIVVGADGRHSVVARETDAPFERSVDPITAGYYSYYADTGVTRTQLFFREGFVCVMFPTNDDLTLVAIAWRNHLFPQLKRDIQGHFDAALLEMGELAEGARSGTRAERFVGTADIPNYVRKTHGPGWVLVGDACYHKDPTPADGITDAFRSAQWLADALHQVLAGEAEEQSALDDYERKHDDSADKRFDLAIRSARFDISPQDRLGAFIEDRVQDAAEVDALLGGAEVAAP